MDSVKLFFVIIVLFSWTSANGDKPCAVRRIPGESVVCVCNETYCDTVTRARPLDGTYVAYTSTKDGLRYKKTTGILIAGKNLRSYRVGIQIDPRVRYQTIFGFGGAATDAAGINWKNLSEPLQQHLINSYFSEDGLQYNMVRVPIGGSDFSTHAYAYTEEPENDTKLSNFSLSSEDFQYKLPLIKAGMQVSKAPVHMIATVWSPPKWMKTNDAYAGPSRLKTEYYQTFADYIYKFIDKYSSEDVPIWGITTTNEPTSGLLGLNKFNTLGWTADTMGDWIINNLGPTIRNSSFNETKILAVDDQRIFLYYWWNEMLKERPKALDYLDGVGLHYYTNAFTPAALQVESMRSFPGKFLMNTESCEGSFPWDRRHVEPGSWQRAHNYVSDIITNLNHDSVGWVDWNLCLNAEGGPNWDKNFVDSPIIVFPEQNEFHKQPMFYAMGHFSKFMPRGSKRIKRLQKKSIFTNFESVAVLTPDDTVVVVFYNKGSARTVNIRVGKKLASIDCPEDSVVTVEIPNDQ